MVTQNEIDNANSMDIVSYLKSHGVSVKRVGNGYEWESPTGKVSIKGNQWYFITKLTEYPPTSSY